ncbi:myosin heavy chain, cardiac muscle isoform-like [Chironomus tepperi]|uniref:myosin heavy chain, cardiac muscle isoform-like n=1 Tax=Chironomus tepperi TaxID=113505 RepID=UPI00391F4FFA
MTQASADCQLDITLIECNDEIQLQNVLLEQLLNAVFEVSDNIGEMTARDLEYEDCQSEYDMLLELIRKEINTQENLKTEIAEIKKELADSSYVEELKAHALLESLVDQKSRKLSNKFDKKLTKEQIADFQERRVQLEQERNNGFRLQKLNEELESVNLEYRELIAIKEQKMKRYDNLKSTYDDVMSRRAELLHKKTELEQELEELEREDTTSCDESSDDEFSII